MIGKPNNLIVFVSNKIEGLKQDNQNQLMSAIPEGTTFYLKFGYKIKVNSIEALWLFGWDPLILLLTNTI
jgi:hypothetical protein